MYILPNLEIFDALRVLCLLVGLGLEFLGFGVVVGLIGAGVAASGISLEESGNILSVGNSVSLEVFHTKPHSTHKSKLKSRFRVKSCSIPKSSRVLRSVLHGLQSHSYE